MGQLPPHPPGAEGQREQDRADQRNQRAAEAELRPQLILVSLVQLLLYEARLLCQRLGRRPFARAGPLEGAYVRVPERLADEGHRAPLGVRQHVEEGLLRGEQLPTRRELALLRLIDRRPRRVGEDERPALGPVVLGLRLVGQQQALFTDPPLDEPPGRLRLARAGGNGQRMPARPGDVRRLAGEVPIAPQPRRGHRRRRHAELEVGGEAGHRVQHPGTVDDHADLAGEERVLLLGQEARLEDVDPVVAAQRVVDLFHVLQRAHRVRVIEGAGAAIGAHELPAVLPAVEVEPRVTKVGDEADAFVGPVGVRLGQALGVLEQLLPGRRRALRVQADLAEEGLVVQQHAVVDRDRHRVEPALVSRLAPGRRVEVGLADAVGLGRVAREEIVERAEGGATGPIADGEAVLEDDIRRHATDDRGHQLLRVHRARAHRHQRQLDIGVAPLKLGDLGVQAGALAARLQAPDDDFGPCGQRGGEQQDAQGPGEGSSAARSAMVGGAVRYKAVHGAEDSTGRPQAPRTVTISSSVRNILLVWLSNSPK